MKYLIFTLFAVIQSDAVFSQVDTTRRNNNRRPINVAAPVTDISRLNQDSLIKERFVALALNNPAMKVADANIRIGEADLAMAKSSFLGSVNAGANFNEFVIQGSAAASFFPKYNVGLAIPFDMFSKMKREKRVARESITINKELKKESAQAIRAQVLIAYENYKEKKEIVFIQKSSIEYEYSDYQAAQRSYAEGDVTLEEMNKSHQNYLLERSKLVTNEKDLSIAIILLEQLIGMPLADALALPQ